MFGIFAIVAFAIALLLDLANLSKGVLTVTTFVIAGLLCLAVHESTHWGRRA